MAEFGTIEDFFSVYQHLKRPSTLPLVSDYHIFKKGIRPVWEDDENKKGGKWIVRLKKGVADRYWEDLILAIVGDQFAEASEEVCGAVLSVRNGEDILSIWTRNDGGRVLKIRCVLVSTKLLTDADSLSQRDDEAHPGFPIRNEGRMEEPRFQHPTTNRNRRAAKGKVEPTQPSYLRQLPQRQQRPR
jgi:hypothetical protein